MSPEFAFSPSPDRYADTSRRTLSGLELRCPPLPQTLMEAMELMENPDKLDVGPVTAMVQRDPIVVARLLHVVNSAYYGLRHSISSAERAVVMLGPVAVAGIVAGMNMMKLHAVLDGSAAQCLNRLIRHSIATAFLTRHLLEGAPRDRAPLARAPGSRIGVSFTAGLLHDFGKIILVYNFPREAVQFYQDQSLSGQVRDADPRALEQLLFGYDHTEAGEYVARKLNFPDLLIDVIRLHEEAAPPTGTTDRDRLLRAVVAGNLIARAAGFEFGSSIDWTTLAEHPVWALIADLDLRHAESPLAVVEDLKAQQEHLEQYVQHMFSNVAGAGRPAPLSVFSARRAV